MTVRKVAGAGTAIVGLGLLVVAWMNGLTPLYVLGGAVLVIGVLVLAGAFGRTRGRRWALSGIAVPVVAVLIAGPFLLNTSDNPVIEYAPDDDATWVPDGDGAGYLVTRRSVERWGESHDVEWGRSASWRTWTTPGGLVTADDDRVQFLNAAGEVAWERTAYGLGLSGDIDPVAWNDGITVVSVCHSDPESGPAAPSCQFIGIDAAGVEIYRIEADLAATVYPGGLWSYGNSSGSGATGALPTYFGHADGEDDGVSVVDAATGRSVTTLPGGDDISIPAFAGDRVLTGAKSGETCTLSRVPIAGDGGWTTEVPCTGFGDVDESAPVYSSVSLRDGGLLDGEVLWWRPTFAYDAGSDAIGVDLESGEAVPVGKLRIRSLEKGDAAEFALASEGRLVEVRDSVLTVRDPFSDKTTWTAPVPGNFRSVDASTGVLAVVTKPTRPRLFASDRDLLVTVYALDDGRILGEHRFDPEQASHVVALDNAALLVLQDGTSILVGK